MQDYLFKNRVAFDRWLVIYIGKKETMMPTKSFAGPIFPLPTFTKLFQIVKRYHHVFLIHYLV